MHTRTLLLIQLTLKIASTDKVNKKEFTSGRFVAWGDLQHILPPLPLAASGSLLLSIRDEINNSNILASV